MKIAKTKILADFVNERPSLAIHVKVIIDNIFLLGTECLEGF